MSTGLALLDVEPFPRLKLMKLYYMTMDAYRELPETYYYKQLSMEDTKWRMQVVDENLSIRKIEEEIDSGMVEELIIQAHNELRLMRIMKRARPWEMNDDISDAEFKQDALNLADGGAFPEATETFKNDIHVKPERPQTAGFGNQE